jgi:hypothetical protein
VTGAHRRSRVCGRVPTNCLAPQWLRLLPLVGLMLVLVRWFAVPRDPADAPQYVHSELAEAWIVTLATLLGVMLSLALIVLLARG